MNNFIPSQTNNQRKAEREQVVLVGVYGMQHDREIAEEYIQELELLAATAGGDTVKKFLQNRDHPDPGTYIGGGKLGEIAEFVKSENIDAVIFDDDLTATQLRNIEQKTQTKVLDRSNLILDIFASHAKTSAAKTQVELAQLEYLLPRLTRYWTHLSRQKGGIGTKGPGETQIETDRRLIGKRISMLKEKLRKLDKQRKVQRKGRIDNLRISLVGYTNAGKSSLMNALTQSGVKVEDKLFATLDSTVRRLQIGKEDVLLSDTVGFIRKLPHRLIESFKSTLDEIRESDLLIHVVDATSPLMDDYIDTVHSTLKEIGADQIPEIMVINKIDGIDDPGQMAGLKRAYPGAIPASALRGIGLETITDAIEKRLEERYTEKKLHLPLGDQKVVSFLHEVAQIDELKYEEDKISVQFKINRKYLGALEGLLERSDNGLSFVNK